VIAVLVGYLLFGPPATTNKKGTQLAGGNGAGQQTSIIDAGEATGTDGLGAANPDAANQNTGSTGTTGSGTNGNPADNGGDKNSKAGKNGGEAPPAAGKADDRSKDPNWNVLKTGKNGSPTAKAGGNNAAKDSSATGGADKPKPAPKHDDTVVDAQGTPGGRIEQARLYYNPNDAYGGGISTDAVFGKNNGGGGERIGRATGTPRTNVPDASHDVVIDGGGDAAANDGGQSGGGGVATKAPTATEEGVHVVRSGETLSSISLVAYGSSAYYPHILRANPTVNPKNLKLGTPLKMPKIDEVKAATPKEDSAAAAVGSVANVVDGAPFLKEEAKLDPTKQYRVAPRDSLYKIAMRVYGKASYVDKIYEKNKAAIGPDPTRLKLGMVLDLPEAAAAATASPAANPAKAAVETGATADERQPK
jgi:LysM repeat protein